MMPPKAVSRVRNRIQGVIPVDWMVNRVNLELFDEDSKEWNLSTKKLFDSLSRETSTRDLRREFRIRMKERVVSLESLEAKVLGYAFYGMNLEQMEAGLYSNEIGISNSSIRSILETLMKRRVFSMQYRPNISLLGNLFHLCVGAKGPEERVNSLVRSFVKRAATSTAFVSENHDQALVVSRVPRRAVPDLFGRLPSAAQDAGIDLTIWPVKAYSAYQHNIFSRLLLEDGRWDDDVTGLTSQSRSTTSDDDSTL